jgi:hypothetical protein
MIVRTTIDDCKLLELPSIRFREGNLTPVHGLTDVPFELERIFYIYDVPGGEDRGAHAHKTCHQLIVAASGAFDVILNDGLSSSRLTLNRPYFGLYLPPGIWAQEVGFSSGAVCLVLASHPYDESDYIRDFDEYLRYVSAQKKL